jgi:hypothetical protein
VQYSGVFNSFSPTNKHRLRNVIGGGLSRSFRSQLEEHSLKRDFISRCWVSLEEAEYLGWSLERSAEPIRMDASVFRSNNIASPAHQASRDAFEKRSTFVNTEEISDPIDFAEYFLQDARMFFLDTGFSVPSLKTLEIRRHLRSIGLLHNLVPQQLLESLLESTSLSRSTHLGDGCWSWEDLWRYVGTETAIRSLVTTAIDHPQPTTTGRQGVILTLPDAVPFITLENSVGGSDGLFVPAQTTNPVAMILSGRREMINAKKRGGPSIAFQSRRRHWRTAVNWLLLVVG